MSETTGKGKAVEFGFPVADNDDVRWIFSGGEAQPKFDKNNERVSLRDTRENEDTGRIETRYKMSFTLSVKRPDELMPVSAKLPLKFDMWLTDEQLSKYAEMIGTRVRPVGFHINLYAPSGNGRFTPTALSASMKLDGFEPWPQSAKKQVGVQPEQK